MNIEKRIQKWDATRFFADVIADTCVVEGGGNGYSLFGIARRAVIAGAVALTAFATVPAHATDITMPTSAAAGHYMDEMRSALRAHGSGPFGVGIVEIERHAGFTNGYIYGAEKNDINWAQGQFFTGSKCVVWYGDHVLPQARYSHALKLKYNADLGGLEEMNAVSACGLVGLMDSTTYDQYDNTTTGVSPLVEILTLAASAKYQPERLGSVYAVMNGLAYSQIRSTTGDSQVEAAWKLAALRKVYQYANDEGGRRLVNATPAQLVALSDMASRSAQSEVSISGLAAYSDGSGNGTGLSDAMAKSAPEDFRTTSALLRINGFADLTNAIDDAQRLGLTTGKDFESGYVSAEADHCKNTSSYRSRHRLRFNIICEIMGSISKTLDGPGWKASGKTFVGDFSVIADDILSSMPTAKEEPSIAFKF